MGLKNKDRVRNMKNNKNKLQSKIIMALAVTGCVFTTFSATAGPQNPASKNNEFVSAKPKMRQDYWQKRQNTITQFLNSTKDLSDVKLVFIGDSITDFWSIDENPWFPGLFCGLKEWNGTFSNGPKKYKAINLGISGDRTEHILYRLTPSKQGGLGELDRKDLKPEFVIILVGINNSFEFETPKVESITAGIKAVILAAHQKKPNATIILQSLLPTAEADRNSTVVNPVNAILANIENDKEFSKYIKFLDLHKYFIDDKGNQITNYFNDGLHPNRNGYAIWKKAIISKIDELRSLSGKPDK